MDGTTAKYTMTIHDLTWFDSMIILGALHCNVLFNSIDDKHLINILKFLNEALDSFSLTLYSK